MSTNTTNTSGKVKATEKEKVGGDIANTESFIESSSDSDEDAGQPDSRDGEGTSQETPSAEYSGDQRSRDGSSLKSLSPPYVAKCRPPIHPTGDPVPVRSNLPGKATVVVAAVAVAIFVIPLLQTVLLSGSPDGGVSLRCQKAVQSQQAVSVVQNMSLELPPQNALFLATLKSQVRSVYNSERPSCILMAVVDYAGSAADVLGCISKHLECTLSGRTSSLNINGAASEFRNGRSAKSSLDDQLSSHFSAGSRVAVIENVHKLQLETAHILYKYCDDNDKPAYPRTMLLLSTPVVADETPSQSWLYAILKSAWTSDPDLLTPLLSRIGNNIVLLNTNGATNCTL